MIKSPNLKKNFFATLAFNSLMFKSKLKTFKLCQNDLINK